jgi:hypothetical protein
MKIEIKSEEFWVKIVDMLQQNWALIEVDERNNKATIFFIHDGSGIFDKLEFNSVRDAEKGLLRNGFKKYLDENENFAEFIIPPKKQFFESPRNIYSSGQYWR